MKHCKYCGQDRPMESFSIRRASKDGLSFKCKSCARAYGEQRYRMIAERFKARAKAWAQENPQRRLEIRRASALRHAEEKRLKSREYNRRTRQEDPERVRLVGRMSAKLRKERLLGIEGTASIEEVSALLERAGGVCVYCGAVAKLTLDHFDPVARGGSGYVENLIPCCKSCNSSKNASDPVDWIHRRLGVAGLGRTVMFLEGNLNWNALREPS